MQSVLIGFVELLAAFRALQLLRPRDERLSFLRRGFWTDLAYWAFTPLVRRAITRITVLVAIVPVAMLVYSEVDNELLNLDWDWGPLRTVVASPQFHRWYHTRPTPVTRTSPAYCLFGTSCSASTTCRGTAGLANSARRAPFRPA